MVSDDGELRGLAWIGVELVLVAIASAVLSAGRQKMDLFGVIMLGAVTALGGGTIRDMVLGA